MTQTSGTLPRMLRDVPLVRLVAAIGYVMKQRAGIPDDVPYHTPEIDIEAFVATCDKRQLRLLRKIALSLILIREGRFH
jgi:hypothetical protein